MRIAEMTKLGEITFREVPRPEPGPGEIVLRIHAVGICGTDLKAYRRGHPYFAPPCVLGHEFSGTVHTVGADVSRFTVGDRVVAAPYVECGGCEVCQRGLGELCRQKPFVSGALQEYVLLPEEIVNKATFALRPDISFATASLAEPLACVINGIEKAAVSADDTVLVIGGGPMGALLALVARSITPDLAISEIAPARIEALGRLGLPVINPSVEDLPERLEMLFGRPAASQVLIAVGLPPVAEGAMKYVAPGGTALLFGGLPKGAKLTVDPYAIHYQEVTLCGSFGFRLEHFRRAVEWLEVHGSLAKSLISSTVRFEEVETAFTLAEQAEGLKTVVLFEENDER